MAFTLIRCGIWTYLTQTYFHVKHNWNIVYGRNEKIMIKMMHIYICYMPWLDVSNAQNLNVLIGCFRSPVALSSLLSRQFELWVGIISLRRSTHPCEHAFTINLMFVQLEGWSTCDMALNCNHVYCMSRDELTLREHPALLYRCFCSSAEPNCVQAIRELPLLPLTSFTCFADNTHISLSFLFFSFILSLSFFMCAFEESCKKRNLCTLLGSRPSCSHWRSYLSGHSHELL